MLGKRLISAVCLFVLCLTLTGQAQIQDIPVPDAGFDDHVLENVGDWIYLGDGAYTGAWQNRLPGEAAWVDYGYFASEDDLVALSGNNKLFATYPEGVEDYVYQILDETFVAGATYTLSVWVGIAWSGYSDGWSLKLTGEDHAVNLAEASGTAPVGAWEQVSLEYTATAADAGNKIGIKIETTAEYVTFDDVTLTYQPPARHNRALFGTATSSSTGWGWLPEHAIDGDYGTGSHSNPGVAGEWLEVALDRPADLTEIRLVNRASCCDDRIIGNIVIVMDADGNVLYVSDPIEGEYAPGSIHTFDNGGAGFAGASIIRVEQTANTYVQIMELEALVDAWPFASEPTPASGSIEVDGLAAVQWEPADGAVSYNVYVSGDETIEEGDLVASVTGPEWVLPEEAAPGVTYYWRVDAVDGDGNVSEGDVWNLSTLALEAHFPVPGDGLGNVVTPVELSWTAGKGALVHNVFLSTDQALVEAKDPSVQVGMWLSGTEFDPGALDAGTTYFWAVDEFLGAVTNPGPVWSFTTVPEFAIDDPNLIVKLEFNEGEFAVAVDSSGHANHGAFVNGPEWGEGVLVDNQALVLDGVNQYVDVVLDVPENGCAVAFWFNTTNPNAGLFAVVDAVRGGGGHDRHIHLSGGNLRIRLWDTEVIVTAGLDVADGCWHHVAYTYGDAVGGQRLYVDGTIQARGTKPNSNFDWQKRVHFGFSNDAGSQYLGGLLDEARIYDRTLGPDEVVGLMQDAVVEPCGPEPGIKAIVDDFEGYDDADNPIFDTWVGAGGAMVGNAEPPYSGIRNRHSGAYAMPLAYDNSAAGASEATVTFPAPQDASSDVLNRLSLWVRGGRPNQDTVAYDEASDTYTVTSNHSGDVWGGYDTCHFVYQEMTGDGEIIARIDGVKDLITDGLPPQWVRSGLMIRESVEPGSKHAGVCMEVFQNMVWALFRTETSGAAAAPNDTHRGPQTSAVPVWLKLNRTGNVFSMWTSVDGSNWEGIVEPNVPVTAEVEMSETVLVGLLLNSRNWNAVTEMKASNVTINGAAPTLMSASIGDTLNSPEPLYVAAEDALGAVALVEHTDGALPVGTVDWTQWIIPTAAFANKGVDLTQVTKLSIGLGDGDEATPGGAGVVDIDDIELVPAPGAVTLENPSFELPGGIKKPGFDDVPGWSTDAAAAASGVEPGYKPSDGYWTAYLKGTDPSIWQLTGQRITEGDEFKLTVDARRIKTGSSYDGKQKLTMILYHEGSRVPIASKTVGLKTGMQTFSLSAVILADSAAIGQNIGIELVSKGALWIGVDNVRLEVK